ncbi:MAG: cysteine hydrolase [Deltaproteobacteria bacterium]|nr:cysteine hydrolase [Deltaproteobacteria bacterium]
MKQGLLLVDIQNDYFPGGKVALAGMTEAGLRAGRLLSYFREKGLATFHIQHLSTAPKAGFFVPNTEGVEIHENVKPLPDDMIIRKHYPNSFRETSLLEDLKKAGIEEVVVCGAMSHMCLDATTRAAADHGFKCIVVHDACAAMDLSFDGKAIPADQVHGAFMAALGFAYARVISLDEFLK